MLSLFIGILGGAQPNFWCSALGVTSQMDFLLSLAPYPGA